MFKTGVWLGFLGVAFLSGCRTGDARPSTVATAPQPSARQYTNPVGGGIRMGDPFVMFHEGTYYLYGTNYRREGFRAYTSRNLVDWTDGGIVYKDDTGTCRGSEWAPEVHARAAGGFVLIFSCTMLTADGGKLYRLVLADGDRPLGPFRNVKLPWFEDQGANIDPHLLFDGDRTYLYFDKVGFTDGVIWGKLFGVELRPDLQGRIGEPVLIGQADQAWEMSLPNNRTNEGAFVWKHGDRYHLTYSGNGFTDPNYGIGHATASAPLGPWTKEAGNPVVGRHVESNVSGPGHSSIVPSPDGTERFLIYHAHADALHPSGDRTVNIDRLVIDPAGGLRVLGPSRSPQRFPSGAR